MQDCGDGDALPQRRQEVAHVGGELRGLPGPEVVLRRRRESTLPTVRNQADQHQATSVSGACGGGFWYTVDLEGEMCSCKDYRRREEACKHIYAVTIYDARGGSRQGSVKTIRGLAPKNTS